MSELTLYPLKSIVKGNIFFNGDLTIDDGMTKQCKDKLFKIVNYDQDELSTGFDLHKLVYIISPHKSNNNIDDNLCFDSMIARHSELILVNNKIMLKDNKCK